MVTSSVAHVRGSSAAARPTAVASISGKQPRQKSLLKRCSGAIVLWPRALCRREGRAMPSKFSEQHRLPSRIRRIHLIMPLQRIFRVIDDSETLQTPTYCCETSVPSSWSSCMRHRVRTERGARGDAHQLRCTSATAGDACRARTAAARANAPSADVGTAYRPASTAPLKRAFTTRLAATAAIEPMPPSSTGAALSASAQNRNGGVDVTQTGVNPRWPEAAPMVYW